MTKEPGDSPSRSATSEPHLIQAVDRAVRLLKAVATSNYPLTVPELARLCRLNRSTAWRLLATLEHHGLVERDPDTQRYTTGYGAVQIAAAAGDYGLLIRRARPALAELASATGETINLTVIHQGAIVAIDQIGSSQFVSIDWRGTPLPLYETFHCTSVGKVMLSFLSDSELAVFLDSPMRKFTSATVDDVATLKAALRKIRKTGYGSVAGEFEEGLSSVCAPLLDERGRAIAFVTVSGPSYRMPRQKLQEFGELAKVAAERMRRALLFPVED